MQESGTKIVLLKLTTTNLKKKTMKKNTSQYLSEVNI